MGESAELGSADEDLPDGARQAHHGRTVVPVADAGDVVLDLTFETSSDTLKKTRKAALEAARKAVVAPPPRSALKPKVKVAYRVSLEAMKKHSKYFANLLSNAQFREAKLIVDTHRKLVGMGIKPGEASVEDLPWVTIVDDDDATKAAGREHAFEDMLRIIHQKTPKTTRATMSYVATLAILADRFDCISPVSRSLNLDLRFKWPATSAKPMRDEQGRATETEQVLRQKILVSWLLGHPMRLHQASRELILRGSCLWSPFHDTESDWTAAWWNLPHGLEHELQCRRECILNTIASVQRHFLRLYSSKERQCKLGYDSSTACDSFQLGQMLKFLVSKDLLFLVDYSPMSLESVPDTSLLDIEEILSVLKQCPSYQVDKHHTNCGLRTRIDPILDFIRASLSASIISISHVDWKKRQADISWVDLKEQQGSRDDEVQVFSFTRTVATDQRLRLEGAFYADRIAKNLFTADSWDWTPEI